MHSARFADLEDASVLITGGGSGIGAALTAGFARQGAQVAFIDIAAESSRKLCDSLEREVSRRPLFLEMDLRDIEALRGAVKAAEKQHGAVTVLVNNAAYDERHEIEGVSEDFWNENQAINLRPVFFAVQAVAPGMKAAGGGSIINFSSISFMLNMGDMPSYTAAKAGIIGLTKGLAGKLGPDRIRVNAVAPGWVMTERQRKLWVTDEVLDAFLERQCIPEALQPEDMVGTVLFLASDASKMLTAQTVIIDGGVM